MERTAGRRVSKSRRGRKDAFGARERRRLAQLCACLLLFLAAFLAKGVDRLAELRQEVAWALGQNGDFEAVGAVLDGSVSSRRPVGETIGRLWMGIFMPKEKETLSDTKSGGPGYAAAKLCLETKGGTAALLTERTSFYSSLKPADRLAENAAVGVSQIADAGPQEEAEVTAMGYTGPALPENTSMDKYALHLEKTVSPVVSHITSGFGWREDPMGEGERFHNGLDLAAAEGTSVLAFASGVVDYIGESDIYGQYLQLDHGNGVKSFYAHCSKLCVRKGVTVSAGDKVAESGATGNVTGPHLHFELKKDGVRLNPAYYIEFEA